MLILSVSISRSSGNLRREVHVHELAQRIAGLRVRQIRARCNRRKLAGFVFIMTLRSAASNICMYAR